MFLFFVIFWMVKSLTFNKGPYRIILLLMRLDRTCDVVRMFDCILSYLKPKTESNPNTSYFCHACEITREFISKQIK